jgi:hypothetical protein
VDLVAQRESRVTSVQHTATQEGEEEARIRGAVATERDRRRSSGES